MAEIITDFVMRNAENKEYDDFFSYNDLGIPLAVAFNANLCTLNPDGRTILSETFVMLCERLKANPDEEYEDLDDLLDNIE